MNPEIVLCTKADYDQIIQDIESFWGSTRTLGLHQPFLIHEFGNTAFVIKDGNMVAAYLFGFLAQTGPTAYTHLIAVRPEYRREGLAARLYDYFIQFAQAQGCTRMKAITSPTNAASIAFHTRIGMRLLGEPNIDGIPVVKDYKGPGEDRVVFEMDL